MDSLTLPTEAQLHVLLSYDPVSGELTWKPRPGKKAWNTKHAGKPALNTANAGGYRRGCINGVHCYAHRVIWKMTTGEDAIFIDHINGVRSDNRLANLRAVTPEENLKNQGVRRDNKSGVPGVFWYERYRMWQVTCCSKFIGRFPDLDIAIAARRRAEKLRSFHPNHGRRKAA